MGKWSVARTLIAIVAIALALAGFVNASPVLAEWVEWILLAALAIATLAAIVRAPRLPSCVGFAVFGWIFFIPTYWLAKALPTDRLLGSLVTEVLRSRRPTLPPSGVVERQQPDGTLRYDLALPPGGGNFAPPIPERFRSDIYEAYSEYHSRFHACKRIGQALAIALLGIIGSIAGRMLASRTAEASSIANDDPRRVTSQL